MRMKRMSWKYIPNIFVNEKKNKNEKFKHNKILK